MAKSTGSDWSYAAVSGGIVNTSDVAIKAAVVGQRNFLSSIQIINAHATTSTEVVVKDGSTVIFRTFAAAASKDTDPINFDPPLVGTANTALNVACITTGTTTYVNAQGFVAY